MTAPVAFLSQLTDKVRPVAPGAAAIVSLPRRGNASVRSMAKA
jgi:hypothetical protein